MLVPDRDVQARMGIKMSSPIVGWQPASTDTVTSASVMKAKNGRITGYRVFADRTINGRTQVVEYDFTAKGRLKGNPHGKADVVVTLSKDAIQLLQDENADPQVTDLTDNNQFSIWHPSDVQVVDDDGLFKVSDSSGDYAYVVGQRIVDVAPGNPPHIENKFDTNQALIVLTEKAKQAGLGGKLATPADTEVTRLAENTTQYATGVTNGLDQLYTAQLNGEAFLGGTASTANIYAMDPRKSYNPTPVDPSGTTFASQHLSSPLPSSAVILRGKKNTLWQPPVGSTLTALQIIGGGTSGRIYLESTLGGNKYVDYFNTAGKWLKRLTI